jgi:CheY-like chemotaxis protein
MVVLYAEDDIDDFNIFCEVLESINPLIKVINARNGIEALDMLDNLPKLPDFIFLDINMPTMDGTACLKRIKSEPKFRQIPVIIYTTTTDKRYRDQCMEFGATRFLIKSNSLKVTTDDLSEIFC